MLKIVTSKADRLGYPLPLCKEINILQSNGCYHPVLGTRMPTEKINATQKNTSVNIIPISLLYLRF